MGSRSVLVAQLGMVRFATIVVVGALACSSGRVGGACAGSADCGPDELCDFPRVACGEPCVTEGTCRAKRDPKVSACASPATAGISCSTGETRWGGACGYGWSEPVHAVCPP
jgi:hypothetical protein